MIKKYEAKITELKRKPKELIWTKIKSELMKMVILSLMKF
jgi:ribosomal protein L24E